MNLTIQPETDLSLTRAGSVIYAGGWEDCRAALAAFAVSVSASEYSFVSWKPGAVVTTAPPRRRVAKTATPEQWLAAEEAVIAAGETLSLAATLRAREGGRGQLSVEILRANGLQAKIMEALRRQGDLDDGERSWSFSVTAEPRDILADKDAATQEHIAAWLAAPAALRARFFYENSETGYNASLTNAEKEVARRILAGDDTDYSDGLSVTLTITDAKRDATDLPDVGAEEPPPASHVHLRLGEDADLWTWRVSSSGTALNPRTGLWSGGVTWEGKQPVPLVTLPPDEPTPSP